MQIDFPPDREADFEPVIVRKVNGRWKGIDEIVLSPTARDLTAGEAAADIDEVYDATVTRDTISKITDEVFEETAEWAQRRLSAVYTATVVHAIHVMG